MPVAPITDNLPWFADPAKASVTDPLYLTLLRKAVSLSGIDDPVGSVAPTPLVSMYPNKQLREAGTRTFRELASKLPDNIAIALDDFAHKYPRVAAHIKPMEAKPYQEAGAYLMTPGKGPVKEPMPMGFTPLGKILTGANTPTPGGSPTDRARRLVWHEGTHAAQMLGNKDQPELYRLSNTAFGYNENPFEQTAEQAANAVRYGQKQTVPDNAVRILNWHMANAPVKSMDRYQIDALSDIYNILRDRIARGWTPSK